MKRFTRGVTHQKNLWVIGFIFLLILLVMLCITSLFFPIREAFTYDEFYHYQSGEAILKGEAALRGDRDPFARNIMPISALNPLSAQVIKTLLPIVSSLSVEDMFLGKSATIVVGVILAIYVFIWSRKLYGVSAAFLALILYTLDPNILAHSRVITQDMFGAASIFIAIYYFWSFLKFGSRTKAFLSILTFGIAQISRFTSVHLIPIFLILSIGFYYPSIWKAIREKNISLIRRGSEQVLSYTIILILSTILIINTGFSFERTFTRFGDYKFQSQSLKNLQTNSLLKQVPVPVPYAYLQGLDFGKYKQESGFGSGMPYVLGKLGFEIDRVKGFQIKPFKEYYLITFLYKVPIATQILFVLSLLSLWISRKHLQFWQNESFLLIPFLYYFTFMSFNTAQLGIRYILMIFPFLFVLTGRVVTGWNARRVRYRVFIASLIIYLLISNLSYFPHYIAYFNELVTNRKFSYKILVDSNLDWGQSEYYRDRYLLEHPNAMFIRYEGDNTVKAIVGNQKIDPHRVSIGKSINLLIVEANQLVGVTTDENRFHWLRSSREPIDHIAGSYLVFPIDEKDAPDVLK